MMPCARFFLFSFLPDKNDLHFTRTHTNTHLRPLPNGYLYYSESEPLVPHADISCCSTTLSYAADMLRTNRHRCGRGPKEKNIGAIAHNVSTGGERGILRCRSQVMRSPTADYRVSHQCCFLRRTCLFFQNTAAHWTSVSALVN